MIFYDNWDDSLLTGAPKTYYRGAVSIAFNYPVMLNMGCISDVCIEGYNSVPLSLMLADIYRELELDSFPSSPSFRCVAAFGDTRSTGSSMSAWGRTNEECPVQLRRTRHKVTYINACHWRKCN